MSLLRLLTTGKSLVGLKDTESRYRLTSQRLLPQFGPAKNPFSSTVESDSGRPRAYSPEADRANNASRETRDLPPVSGKVLAGLPNAALARAVSAGKRGCGVARALRLRLSALLSGWTARLSGLLKRSRSETPKPAIPRFTKQPVQGELSLDRIRVVRNDLSDADLEVVPARHSATAASPAPAVPIEQRAAITQNTWGRMTTRIFGAGRT